MPATPQEGTTPARAAALSRQGSEIMRARRAKGLGRKAGAEALGVPVATLQSWEQGKRGCPPEMRRRIVEEWEARAKVLALNKDHACPCCGRPYDDTARKRR